MNNLLQPALIATRASLLDELLQNTISCIQLHIGHFILYSLQSMLSISPSVAQWLGRLGFTQWVSGSSLRRDNSKIVNSHITQAIFQHHSD